MRLREPVAWLVVAVTATSIVLALVRFGVELSGGLSFAAAAQDVALSAMSLAMLVVVVALVWACVFLNPVTPRARQLVAVAATVVTLGTLLTLVGAVLGLTASAGAVGVLLEFLGGLLDIVVKTIGVAVLWLTHRGLQGGRIAPQGTAPEPAVDVMPPPAVPPTVWSADTAAGSVWASAADAAAGTPATGLPPAGSPSAGTGGWRPVSRPSPASPSPEEGSAPGTR